MTDINVSECIINASISLFWTVENSKLFIPSFFPTPIQQTLYLRTLNLKILFKNYPRRLGDTSLKPDTKGD